MINNNEGNSVNIVLKNDQREFPFSLTLKIINNGSVNHRRKSSEIFATKKSVRGSHFSFFSFLPRLKLEKNSTEYNCVETKRIIKEIMKHDQSVPVS